MSTTIDTPEDRARQADKIVKNPSNYKICEGCDSIVLAKAHTCPNCAGYRFQEGKAITLVTEAEVYFIGKIEKLIREKIPVRPLPPEIEIEKTPFAEAQVMAREIDRQKRLEDPDFKGAFHEKK